MFHVQSGSEVKKYFHQRERERERERERKKYFSIGNVQRDHVLSEPDIIETSSSTICVTRLGDLLHFGQLFKACGNNYFAQITHILGNFCKVVKIFHFSIEIILGNFYRNLATFTGHTVLQRPRRRRVQISSIFVFQEFYEKERKTKFSLSWFKFFLPPLKRRSPS